MKRKTITMSKTRKTLAWLLWPLTVWYGIGVWVRNLLFSTGVLKETTMPVTTIGVGNLACGGTGKTPMVEYLLRLFGEEYRTALLSRGYRRATSGYVEHDGSNDASLLGDESTMVARKFPNVTVAVCEKRVEGVRQLLQNEEPPQLIVLDDVYQHRYIKPTVNILLTEFHHPFFSDHVLPFGNLREYRKAYRRAHIIVVTKSPQKFHPMAFHNLRQKLKVQSYQRLYFSYIEYDTPTALYADGDASQTIALDTVSQVLLVTGIAHPDDLIQHVKQHCKVVSMPFEDHHQYTVADVAKIRERFNQMKSSNRIVLVTEKDAVKLQNDELRAAFAGIPVYSIPIRMVIMDNKDDSFNTTLRNRVKENIFFQQRISANMPTA